jgi:catechol 2,3-dioxygenase-like lactoylglutathione lyase family enzyme
MKIEELILDTGNLTEQISFYQDTLNFKLIKRTESYASFQIGESILTFISKDKALPYHFAFNIPSNNEKEALQWLKNRVEIIPYKNDEIIDFVNWEAKAIYFYDRDHNIVEFIARRVVNNENLSEFNSKSVLNISEIGIGTYNIKQIYQELNNMKPISIFDGSFEKFCALGNNEGLFIVVDLLKKDWFPAGDKIHISDFTVNGDYSFEYRDGKLKELI